MSIKNNTTSLQELLEVVNALPEAGGIELPTLTNEGSASDLLSGKQLIDGDGNVVTGTIPTQAAKTITPTKSSQTAVASGMYTTGAITVAAIPSQYITTSDATASANEIMNGETAYVNGSKVTGTFTIDSELSTQDDLIAQIQSAVDNLPEAGGEQATPEISVNNSNGLITATAGDKSSTYQLAFQAAKTITPSATSQIAVSSGYYTGGNITVGAIPSTYVQPSYTKAATTYTPTTTNQTISAGTYLSGAQTIKGDSNLIAGNIKSGVSIFGVNGTLVEGGGGSGDGYDEADSLITMSMTSYTNNRVSTIGRGAFAYASNLRSVSFSLVTSIGDCAFDSCTGLTTISFPLVTSIGNYAFYCCSSLTTASFSLATSIGSSAFGSCARLTTASFPAAIFIGHSAFGDCTSLTTISFPLVTSIGNYAFYCCARRLTTASFPAAIFIGNSAFYSTGLTTISFPLVTSIGRGAFYSTGLTTISFPLVTSIESSAFGSCASLTTASFPAITSIGSYAFQRCYNLKSLYLTGSSLCTLSNSNAFSSTPIGGYSKSAGTYGSIYVPASLLTSYQNATNWTYFSSRFVAYDSGPSLITFTIAGTQYQAEEGMTWADWVNSEYNISEYFVDGDTVTDGLGYVQYKGFTGAGTDVNASELIIEGTNYKMGL